MPSQKETESDRLINDLELDVFELSREDLAEALSAVYNGDEILRLIDQTPNVQSGENGWSYTGRPVRTRAAG